MVCGHFVLADPLGQMARNALRMATRIHEDERRSVLAGELGQSVVHLCPHLSGHHRFQGRCRDLDREIPLANVAGVDDRAVRLAVGPQVPRAYQESRDFLDRFLGS